MRLIIEVISEEEDVLISQDLLHKIWDEITDNDQSALSLVSKTYFIDNFIMNSCEIAQSPNLYYKTKGWKITIKKNMIKSILVAPLICGLLNYLGTNEELSSIVLPTILPMIFEIENIELTKKEEEILVNLPIIKRKKEFRTAEDWYSSLPKKIKKQISELDFKDFIEKLFLSGLAIKDQDQDYLILQKGKFKLTFE